MNADAPLLSDRDLLALMRIAKIWVCASYWEDKTIQRYHELGLVTRIEHRLALTEAGKRAVFQAEARKLDETEGLPSRAARWATGRGSP